MHCYIAWHKQQNKRLGRCFLKSWNLTAFSVTVVNIFEGKVFVANTCKLRQPTLKKVLLKTQWAVNVVFGFRYFLLLDKKQREQLYILLPVKSWQAMKSGTWVLILLQSNRQKTEVLKGPQQPKDRNELEPFWWNHQSIEYNIPCLHWNVYMLTLHFNYAGSQSLSLHYFKLCLGKAVS